MADKSNILIGFKMSLLFEDCYLCVLDLKEVKIPKKYKILAIAKCNEK